MKILILGAGQVGSSAAYHLSREDANEVTVVDTRPDVLRELQDRLDIRTVVGHAAYPEVLERAGGFEPLRFVPAGPTVVLGLISTKGPVLESKDHLLRRNSRARPTIPVTA